MAKSLRRTGIIAFTWCVVIIREHVLFPTRLSSRKGGARFYWSQNSQCQALCRRATTACWMIKRVWDDRVSEWNCFVAIWEGLRLRFKLEGRKTSETRCLNKCRKSDLLNCRLDYTEKDLVKWSQSWPWEMRSGWDQISSNETEYWSGKWIV